MSLCLRDFVARSQRLQVKLFKILATNRLRIIWMSEVGNGQIS